MSTNYPTLEGFYQPRHASTDFFETAQLVAVSAEREAVFLSVLQAQGKLALKSIKAGKNNPLLTATNKKASGITVPELRGANSIDLLHQPNLVPLHIPNGSRRGHNNIHTLQLKEDGRGLVAHYRSAVSDLSTSEEVADIMADKPRLALLQEKTFTEYHQAVSDDIAVRLGFVAAQIEDITRLAQTIGLQLPGQDPNHGYL